MTDWNDTAVDQGPEAVRAAFDAGITPPKASSLSIFTAAVLQGICETYTRATWARSVNFLAGCCGASAAATTLRLIAPVTKYTDGST
jgi:hypothetical protein